MWVAFGSIWYGYEANGWENIPDEGPALIVYYHGAVPIDYYQLVAHCILKKRRVIHSVVDTFLFKVSLQNLPLIFMAHITGLVGFMK
jgi:1-acyl-sn-glycerol-3-phosphate acyltransferase